MIQCGYCETRNSDDAKSCESCGAIFKQEDSKGRLIDYGVYNNLGKRIGYVDGYENETNDYVLYRAQQNEYPSADYVVPIY